MRRLSVLTIICAALASAPGCSKKDPNAIETHTEKLGEPQFRALALGELGRLAKAVHGALWRLIVDAKTRNALKPLAKYDPHADFFATHRMFATSAPAYCSVL